MKKIFFLPVLLVFIGQLQAQDLSYSKPGQTYYRELPDPEKGSPGEWSAMAEDINVSFASDNVRYPKERAPRVASRTWNPVAWKGEKVHTQILVWTRKDIPGVSITAGDLVNAKGGRIQQTKVRASFIRYVMTDEFGDGCDERFPGKYDSSLVEDPIDLIDKIPVSAHTVQPIWLSIQVPGDIPAGTYHGVITVHAGGNQDLQITLTVSDHTLPPPSAWKFDLDLWQNFDPIAKVHGVKLWSKEHFELMRPYFTMLAGAGQKCITAFIIEQPWGPDHVYHRNPSLVKWTRKKDGSWYFDYSVFDRYISFMMECGIKQRINCYSMVTWDLSFIYYDEGKGDMVSVSAKPGTPEYNGLWAPMLRDFTRHLKEKGWFGITSIAMDERDMESMRAVFALLKEIDPEWKTALAGGYHPEIARDIYDYCIIIHEKFDADVLKDRKAAGKPSTYYTACGENRPNAFTFSPPAEMVWIGWYAAAQGFTGYLRWAYNDWTRATLQDTRYKTWPAGDCYQVYPGPRSSIRFEKLIEGIQDFEKIRILKEQLAGEGKTDQLKKLDEILSGFTPESLENLPAADVVTKARIYLNGL